MLGDAATILNRLHALSACFLVAENEEIKKKTWQGAGVYIAFTLLLLINL